MLKNGHWRHCARPFAFKSGVNSHPLHDQRPSSVKTSSLEKDRSASASMSQFHGQDLPCYVSGGQLCWVQPALICLKGCSVGFSDSVKLQGVWESGMQSLKIRSVYPEWRDWAEVLVRLFRFFFFFTRRLCLKQYLMLGWAGVSNNKKKFPSRLLQISLYPAVSYTFFTASYRLSNMKQHSPSRFVWK